MFVAAVIGIGVGLAVQGYCRLLRYYQAEGRIAVGGVSEDTVAATLRKHLAGLQTSELVIHPGDSPTESVSLPELMRQGRLSVFPSDNQTISLMVTGSGKDAVRTLAEQIAGVYVAYVTGSQHAQSSKATGRQERLFTGYKQLQQEHERVRVRIAQVVQGLPQDRIDTLLTTVSDKIQERVKEAEGQIGTLATINKAIGALREELVHPTIRLDPERWAHVKSSDRLYSGDLKVLRARHAEYLAILQADMKGLTEALDQVRRGLGGLGGIIGKQLQMKLPEDLSDDLLEMNLAVEKYEGQLAHFQERWDRYRAKLGELLSDPAAADFDGTGTLLSQLRQDLSRRCEQLPTHLDGLLNQLRQGNPGEPGAKLSSLTARQVAASAISPGLEPVQDTWRKVTYHLNRLFPDTRGNVALLTLSRVCRQLQWRLNFRERQLRQILEQQMLASRKREAQNKLVGLQKEFERTSEALIGLYRGLAADQGQLARIAKRWPELQKLQESIHDIERRMAGMENELGTHQALLGPERLEVRPVIVRARSHTGMDPGWEPPASAFLGLTAGLVAVGVMAPGTFTRFVPRAKIPFRNRPTAGKTR